MLTRTTAHIRPPLCQVSSRNLNVTRRGTRRARDTCTGGHEAPARAGTRHLHGRARGTCAGGHEAPARAGTRHLREQARDTCAGGHEAPARAGTRHLQKKQGFRPASFILCVPPYGFRLQLILHGRHGSRLSVLRLSFACRQSPLGSPASRLPALRLSSP